MTRESTVAPTFAPQPPQRMLVWLSDSSASPPAARATSGGSAPASSTMAGRLLEYPAIHERSIQSLSSHSQLAS